MNTQVRKTRTQTVEKVDKPPNQRPDEEKIYRLLIVGGFTGNTDISFINYC